MESLLNNHSLGPRSTTNYVNIRDRPISVVIGERLMMMVMTMIMGLLPIEKRVKS